MIIQHVVDAPILNLDDIIENGMENDIGLLQSWDIACRLFLRARGETVRWIQLDIIITIIITCSYEYGFEIRALEFQIDPNSYFVKWGSLA